MIAEAFASGNVGKPGTYRLRVASVLRDDGLNDRNRAPKDS
jgi:hypothetical protein